MKDPDDWTWGDAWSHGPRGAIFVLAIIAIFVFGGLGIYKYFAPAKEEIRREVYEETKSYQDGTIRDLDNLRLEWLKAEGTNKTAIADIALHRSVDFPEDRLPVDLRNWLAELREGRESED